MKVKFTMYVNLFRGQFEEVVDLEDGLSPEEIQSELEWWAKEKVDLEFEVIE